MKEKEAITSRSHVTRWQIYRATILLLIAIAIVESGIMLVILPLDVSPIYSTILDSTILIITLLPVVYLLILKPALAQMKYALAQSEGQFQSITRNATDAILGMDTHGKINIWNDAAAQMFGYNANEVIGESLHELVVPQEFRSKANEALPFFYKTGDGPIIGKTIELSALHKNGTEFPVELSISSFKMGDLWQATGIIRDISIRKKKEEELLEMSGRLREGLTGTILVIAKAADARDPYTAGHQMRVSQLSRTIAQEMGMESNQIEGIRLGALIHDIGKIQTPAEILSKPGILSANEFSLIKDHAENGYKIIKDIDFPWPVANIVYQHHERIDGSGYPQGLKGDEICLEARIVAVADVVEAISSHRPYRAALGIEKALEEIQTHSGIHYDPKVVEACLKLFAEERFSFNVESDCL